MCKAASFVVTKDKVFWSKMTDSHEEIIREFGLCPEVAGNACVVRCEIVPEGELYDSEPATWIYKTDQTEDTLPEWFDAATEIGYSRASFFRDKGHLVEQKLVQIDANKFWSRKPSETETATPNN